MRYYLFLIVILFSSNGNAGAWGVGSFENDSALDWVYELEESSSVRFLRSTLKNVQGQSYIQVDECAYALAAAEIVASINSASLSNLPDEVKSWIKKHSIGVDNDLKGSAEKAISACANNRSSELAQLWEESSSEEWSSYLENLRARLK